MVGFLKGIFVKVQDVIIPESTGRFCMPICKLRLNFLKRNFHGNDVFSPGSVSIQFISPNGKMRKNVWFLKPKMYGYTNWEKAVGCLFIKYIYKM